jgi:hypothetical protein
MRWDYVGDKDRVTATGIEGGNRRAGKRATVMAGVESP